MTTDLPWDDGDAETTFAAGRLSRRTYASKSFRLSQPESRDHGQPARFVYKVFDNDVETELAFDGEEWVISESPAGRFQLKLLVAREAGIVKQLWIQRVPGRGFGGRVRTLVNLDRDRSRELIELLCNLDNIPISGSIGVRVDDALIRDLFATPSSLAEIYRADPERFRRLIADDESARDLIAASHRRKQLAIFRKLLDDESYFDQLAAQSAGPEEVWQRFFTANPWILGISLTGQLLTSWDSQRLEQIVVGSSIRGPGKRADALLRTSGRVRSMIFAEFKTHKTPLLMARSYRPGCWAPSSEISGAIAQVQGTVNLAVRDIAERIAELAPDDTEVPGEFTYLIRPRSFLIAGSLSEFEGQLGGHDINRVRSFELYRRNIVEPEIVTFDELLARAEWIAESSDDGEF